MARGGCCARLHLREDNARFMLLAVVLISYMLFGATIFMLLERDGEVQERARYYRLLEEFLDDNPLVNRTQFDELLRRHGDAAINGLLRDKRQRWDFAGSFYFVGTVVSTIGFGMTTPRTVPGKIVLILYGFLGCAGGFLFFNLFLERIITFLAYMLRYVHEREMRRKGQLAAGSDASRRPSSQASEDDDANGGLDSWKPSVYWVMLILFLGAVTIACCASAMYHPMEDWSYFESIYFCFVAFATIGFGDYVVSQRADYENAHLYRFANFIFLMIGCSCIYSLFNVTSIVIKQFLNWLIGKLDCRCSCLFRQTDHQRRRNAITPGYAHRNNAQARKQPEEADYDSDASRRGSNEMISMRDFLKANNISLAIMQKQLYETAHRSQHTFVSHDRGGLEGGVGPLAILNKKLGEDDL